MRSIKVALVSAVMAVLLFGSMTPAHAAKPCNQYPTFIQPVTCWLMEKLP
jgi:hypothetical protein